MKTKEGLWKFSPSMLYGYEECPSCFWVENHIGRHPFTLPLRLNDAMDEKLKSRYDFFRKKKSLPPELKVVKGIKLFSDSKKLEEWRNNKTALRYVNKKDGYFLEGKIDELFVGPRGEFIVADYKSSGDPPKEDKQKYYRSQLNAYALMFQEKEFKVADRGYLLFYYTKDRKDNSLSMEFDFKADLVKIDLKKFKKTMKEIVQFLEKDYKGLNKECKKCEWCKKRKCY